MIVNIDSVLDVDDVPTCPDEPFFTSDFFPGAPWIVYEKPLSGLFMIYKNTNVNLSELVGVSVSLLKPKYCQFSDVLASLTNVFNP